MSRSLIRSLTTKIPAYPALAAVRACFGGIRFEVPCVPRYPVPQQNPKSLCRNGGPHLHWMVMLLA